MPKPPARARGARRLNVTPALIANIRHRYERTPERLATMAADLGCCGETVRNMGKREGWVRYVAPPRDLTPAARLRVRAEKLVEQAGQESPPPQQTPFVPAPGSAQSAARVQAPAGTQEQDGKAVPCGPGSPLSRGRTENEEPLARAPQDNGERLSEAAMLSPPPDPPSQELRRVDLPPPGGGEESVASIASQMLREVSGFLDDVRAERKRMKRAGYAKHELQAVSRVIADLAASLARLQPMAQRAAEPDTGIAYDDMPADLDQFRDELARRIDALLAQPPDDGDCAPAAAGDAAPADA